MKETLQVINGKGVSSSLGWTLHVLSLTAIQYEEGDRILTLTVEDRAKVTGELEWILYTPEAWNWTIGDRQEPVEKDRVSSILNRITLAFWKLDMPIKDIV